MQRRSDDPAYQIHDLVRPEREQDAPDPGAAGSGQPQLGSTDEQGEVNQRLNSRARDPEVVRGEEREHGSTTAPEGDTAA